MSILVKIPLRIAILTICCSLILLGCLIAGLCIPIICLCKKNKCDRQHIFLEILAWPMVTFYDKIPGMRRLFRWTSVM